MVFCFHLPYLLSFSLSLSFSPSFSLSLSSPAFFLSSLPYDFLPTCLPPFSLSPCQPPSHRCSSPFSSEWPRFHQGALSAKCIIIVKSLDRKSWPTNPRRKTYDDTTVKGDFNRFSFPYFLLMADLKLCRGSFFVYQWGGVSSWG